MPVTTGEPTGCGGEDPIPLHPAASSAKQKLSILGEVRQADMTVSGVCQRHGAWAGYFYARENQSRQGAVEALQASRQGPQWPDKAVVLEVDRYGDTAVKLRVAIAR